MLAILVPARNEEENIGFVLDILTEITSSPEDIFVIDNNSTDNTTSIALERKVRLIHVKEIGYEKAISKALKNVKDLEYTKLLRESIREL